jgi:hypothetical protein
LLSGGGGRFGAVALVEDAIAHSGDFVEIEKRVFELHADAVAIPISRTVTNFAEKEAIFQIDADDGVTLDRAIHFEARAAAGYVHQCGVKLFGRAAEQCDTDRYVPRDAGFRTALHIAVISDSRGEV